MTTSIRSEATRSIVVVNGVDRLALNNDGSMELLTPAASPSGNKIPTAGQLPFTKEYVSPEQTITAGGTLSLSHGLGVTPKLLRTILVCKTSEAGYSGGDELDLSGFQPQQAASAAYGVGITPGSSSIAVIFANSTGVFLVPVKSTGAIGVINPANWRLIVRAWA